MLDVKDIERSDAVLDSGIKLKDYLDLAIDELTNEYINFAKSDTSLDYQQLRKYRNILLCIREICKARNKF